jgi:hypothetical protein
MTLRYEEGGFLAIGGGSKICGISGSWCSKEVEGPFEVEMWKHIRRGWRIFF